MASPIPTTEPVTGLLLCGGAGRRMGGADKGLISFHGRLLIDIAIDRLSPQVNALIINANRNRAQYLQRGLPVITDPVFGEHAPSYEGPLAGILAGLQAADTPWMVTVPCDCPLFPLDIVSQLWACRSAGGAYIAEHPTFALVPIASRTHLEHFLQHGKRKLGLWLAEIGAAAVVACDETAFRNLNTPEDLEA
ncbi:MAG: molybdenum cofactor guanylyltransferase [Betaproteobacteria bacterium]|nr:molybdenum cofactor guanylyltransferase [Betaproteobacteria bacterium]